MGNKKWSVLMDEDDGVFNPFASQESASSVDSKTNDGLLQPEGSTDTAPPTKSGINEGGHNSDHTPSAVDAPENSDGGDSISELLVCAGGTCVCDKAKSSNKAVSLHVMSHQQYFINDADGAKKFIATTRENNIAALNFSLCKVPDPSKPVPCTAQLQWKKHYEKVELPGKAYVLTEKSEATCIKGGQITIKTTGQQQSVTQKDLEKAKNSAWSAVNPMAQEQDVNILQCDDNDTNEQGVGVEKIELVISGAENNSFPPNSTIAFKVPDNGYSKKNPNPTPAQKKAIDWIIYNTEGTPITMRNDVGPAMSSVFNKPGAYIIEAFGKNPQATSSNKKERKESAFLRINIKENTIAEVATADKQTKVRIGAPVIFNIATLFPVEREALRGGVSSIQWEVKLVKGDIAPQLSPTQGITTVVTATEECQYIVTARHNNVVKQSKLISAIKNKLTGVKSNKDACRIKDSITFDVKDSFELPPLPTEIALIKWKCMGANNQPVAAFASYAGRLSVTHQFDIAGKYTVQPYLISPSDKVKATVTVQEPELTFVSWQDAEGNMKNKCGWNDPNHLSLTFTAAEELFVNIEIGVTDKEGKKYRKISAPTKYQINNNNHVNFSITLKENEVGKIVKEGDLLCAKITSASEGYPTLTYAALQPITKVSIITGAKIIGRGFYDASGKAGKPLQVISFGTTVWCRVYAVNMEKVHAALYKVLGGGTRDEQLRKEVFTLDKSKGYIEFEQKIEASWAGDKNLMSFQLGAEEDGWSSGAMITAYQTANKGDHLSTVRVQKVEGAVNTVSGNCFCNKDFTTNDLKKIVKLLTGQEKIWQFANINDKSFESLQRELNSMFRSYGINSCMQKICFLAQVSAETSMFNISEEKESQYASSRFKYKGRGIIQLTGDTASGGPDAYKRYQTYLKDKKGINVDIVNYPEKIAEDLHLCIDSAGWEWSVDKKCPSWNGNSEIIKWKNERFCKALSKDLNKIAIIVEVKDEENDYFFLISKLLNGYPVSHKLDPPHGWNERKRAFYKLKNDFFEFDKRCKKSTDKPTTSNSCELCKANHYDLSDKVKWQTQFDPKWGDTKAQNVACWRTCHDILIKSGLSNESGTIGNYYQTAKENTNHTQLIIDKEAAKQGVIYLDSQLEKGNPVLVGIDHDLNYKGGGLNEGTTDHFIVIVGKKCEEGKIYYLFYDVGTRHKEKGESTNNKLYLKGDCSLTGTTTYNGKVYTVTQIRHNK